MTLLRAAARTMLASYFIVTGAKALKDPTPFVADADPVADKIVPLARKVTPAQVSDRIPDDTATLVRINGAVQLLGGLALATGKGRRLGATALATSLVPQTLAEHPFWSRDTSEARAADRSHFLKNVAVMGGVLLAARDTEGKPGLVWRAEAGSHQLAKSGKRATKSVKRGSKRTVDAVADSGQLLDVAAGKTRRARKKAKRQLKHASKQAKHQARQAKRKAKSIKH